MIRVPKSRLIYLYKTLFYFLIENQLYVFLLVFKSVPNTQKKLFFHKHTDKQK